MDKNVLIKKINNVIADEFEVDMSMMTPEANIKKSLQLDSLSLVDLVALVEESFGVSFKGMEVSSIQTFGALYDFVYQRIS